MAKIDLKALIDRIASLESEVNTLRAGRTGDNDFFRIVATADTKAQTCINRVDELEKRIHNLEVDEKQKRNRKRKVLDVLRYLNDELDLGLYLDDN